jgi:3'-phosphoadenosine 5'-phosphosulfate sulfotransferase (PAPS reductase)/FAD synthetase
MNMDSLAIIGQIEPSHQDNIDLDNIPVIQDDSSIGALLFRKEDGSIDWDRYQIVIVAFSGGKDSLACVLHIIELGCPREKIELWHHDIDGQGKGFMDWTCTPSYCKAVAKALGVKIYFSWRIGGYEAELLKKDKSSEGYRFETPEGAVVTIGCDGKIGTRLMFPQLSGSLKDRWCSAYLKIDVAARALINQKRFEGAGKATLFITGERAEESAGRAKYPEEQPHKTSKNKRVLRRVDQWRPVHKWSTAEVWAIIKRWKIKAHPCYRLGWGRCSCAGCIFGSPNQWASLKAVNPELYAKIANYEQLFSKTIDRKLSLDQKSCKGCAYKNCADQALIAESQDANWDLNNEVIEIEWTVPAGMLLIMRSQLPL